MIWGFVARRSTTFFSAMDAGKEELPTAGRALFVLQYASLVPAVVRCRWIVLSPPFGEQVAPRSTFAAQTTIAKP
jgi:hypothetical protein